MVHVNWIKFDLVRPRVACSATTSWFWRSVAARCRSTGPHVDLPGGGLRQVSASLTRTRISLVKCPHRRVLEGRGAYKRTNTAMVLTGSRITSTNVGTRMHCALLPVCPMVAVAHVPGNASSQVDLGGVTP